MTWTKPEFIELRFGFEVTMYIWKWNRAVTDDLGWPKKSDMAPAQLAKYGFADMHQFRNWRWFKNLGGGPLSDLGAHQIDIFNWWFGLKPRSVLATGGIDYYQKH